MIEILILINVTRRMAAIARKKRRNTSWAALMPLMWFGGELGGATLAIHRGAEGMEAYGPALLGAAIGAMLAWVIIRGLTPIPDDKGLPRARVV